MLTPFYKRTTQVLLSTFLYFAFESKESNVIFHSASLIPSQTKLFSFDYLHNSRNVTLILLTRNFIGNRPYKPKQFSSYCDNNGSTVLSSILHTLHLFMQSCLGFP